MPPRTFSRKNNCFTNALSCVFAFAAFQTSVRTSYILRFKTLPLRIVAPRAGKGTPFHKYSRPNPGAVVSRKLFNRKYFSRQSDSSLSSSLTSPDNTLPKTVCNIETADFFIGRRICTEHQYKNFSDKKPLPLIMRAAQCIPRCFPRRLRMNIPKK